MFTRLSVFIIFILLTISPRLSSQTIFEDNFDAGNSDGWVVNKGTWIVEDQVFSQTSKSQPAKVWTEQSIEWNEGFIFSAKVKLINTQPYKGRTFGWTDLNNSVIFVSYVGHEKRMVIQCNAKGRNIFTTNIGLTKEEWDGSDQQWHLITFQLDGNQLQVFKDGALILEEKRDEFYNMPKSGHIYLETWGSYTSYDDISFGPLTPEMRKKSIENLALVVENKIKELDDYDMETSSIENYLNEGRDALSNESYSDASKKIQEALALADKTLGYAKRFENESKKILTKVEQLQKSGLNTSLVEKALEDAKELLGKEEFEMAMNSLDDAGDNADKIWGFYNSIEYVKEQVTELENIGCDASLANDKINLALDAINNSDFNSVAEILKEANELVIKANCGQVKILDLKAMASKYNKRTIEVIGETRDIEPLYGKGYKFNIDDGTSSLLVEYEGSMKDIENGDEVYVKGEFQKSGTKIKAEIVESSGGIGFIILIVLLVGVLVGGGFFFYNKTKNTKDTSPKIEDSAE